MRESAFDSPLAGRHRQTNLISTKFIFYIFYQRVFIRLVGFDGFIGRRVSRETLQNANFFVFPFFLSKVFADSYVVCRSPFPLHIHIWILLCVLDLAGGKQAHTRLPSCYNDFSLCLSSFPSALRCPCATNFFCCVVFSTYLMLISTQTQTQRNQISYLFQFPRIVCT